MYNEPCCKINLGLNIVGKRDDGYHDIETVFYPIPLYDHLEIHALNDGDPCACLCELHVEDDAVDCNQDDNLVVKAYKMMARHYIISSIRAYLKKNIPMQAGLGGGSADAAYMIRLLNYEYSLNLDIPTMQQRAAELGSDCAFFIDPRPAYAWGRGELLDYSAVREDLLQGFYIALVKPNVAVSTREAYANVTPRKPEQNCKDIVNLPIEEWKHLLHNDFEDSVFARLPVLAEVKTELYRQGALYAQMSGSGSTVFGIFREKPGHIEETFSGMFTSVLLL